MKYKINVPFAPEGVTTGEQVMVSMVLLTGMTDIFMEMELKHHFRELLKFTGEILDQVAPIADMLPTMEDSRLKEAAPGLLKNLTDSLNELYSGVSMKLETHKVVTPTSKTIEKYVTMFIEQTRKNLTRLYEIVPDQRAVFRTYLSSLMNDLTIDTN